MADVLLSLEDAKSQLNIDWADTSQDVEVQDYVGGVEWAVERHLNTTVTIRSFTEEFYLDPYIERPNYARPYMRGMKLALSHTPVVALTSVTRVDGSMTWEVGNLHADPAGTVSVTRGAILSGHLLVTYQAGTEPIPQAYQIAARIILQHLWQTQRGAMGGARPGGLGNSLSTNTGTLAGFAIPNRALELLGGGLPGIA